MVIDDTEGSEGSERRFNVALNIIHPTIDPIEIDQRLGLKASHAQRLGDRRTNVKGTPLRGTYRDTRWRYVERHSTADQWFAHELEKFIGTLQPHEDFFKELNATGGRVEILVQFLGDGYFGDDIPSSIIAKIAHLGLDLGIEVFAVPQV